MEIDSENDLFSKLLKSVSSKINQNVYNRIKQRLVNHTNTTIRLKLISLILKQFINIYNNQQNEIKSFLKPIILKAEP